MEDLETLREREREGISHSVSLLGFLLALRGERCGFICHGWQPMNERVNPLPLSIQKESREIKDIQKTKEKDASVACYSKKTKISFFFRPTCLSLVSLISFPYWCRFSCRADCWRRLSRLLLLFFNCVFIPSSSSRCCVTEDSNALDRLFISAIDNQITTRSSQCDRWSGNNIVDGQIEVPKCRDAACLSC